MTRKKLLAALQIVLSLGVFIAVGSYKSGDVWTSALKVGGAFLVVVGGLLIFKLLTHFKIVDERKLERDMAHSKQVSKQPRAKIAIATMIVGFVMPMTLGIFLFGTQSTTRPGVWSLDYELIKSWAVSLGVSATIVNGLSIYLVCKWMRHWVARVGLSLFGCLTLVLYWNTYFVGEAANLIFVSWALSFGWSFFSGALAYTSYLEQNTPITVELGRN